MKPNLAVEIAGIKMKNPVITASGTFGFGLEYTPFINLNQLGAVVLKGVTVKPRLGNQPPRIIETPAGMLNAIGLQNPGVEYLIKNYLPLLKEYDVPVIANIAGETVEEYGLLAKELSSSDGVAGLEVNISCPNVKKGGIHFGTDPGMAAEVVGEVKANANLPVIVKLSPNVTSIVEIAKAVEQAGADALSLINTLLGMSIDVTHQKPFLGSVTGGLSGPAIRPVAVRAVWQVFKAVKLPIIGMGGIATARDALEFILAGARAVSVGTANFVNPQTTIKVIEEIERHLIENKINDINELVGAAHR